MMKQALFVIAITGTLTMGSCKDQDARYVDPDTGRSLSLVKDANTGLMVDADTKKPVNIYVDTETNDTIYGKTGNVINGHVMLVEGKYKYEDGEYKIKVGDYKEKVESDGDIKIKDGDTKIKIDGETGEVKRKD